MTFFKISNRVYYHSFILNALGRCWHLDCARRNNTDRVENVVLGKRSTCPLVLTSKCEFEPSGCDVDVFFLRPSLGFMKSRQLWEAAAIDVAIICLWISLVAFLGLVTKTGGDSILAFSRPMGES